MKATGVVTDEGTILAASDLDVTSVDGETGQILGTPAFMPPEQAVGEAATPASDRYALAVARFYEDLARRLVAGATGVFAAAGV